MSGVYRGDTPRPGDRVRVTYEAVWDQDRGTHYWLRDLSDGTTSSVPAAAEVEVLERADDPEIGLIRAVSPSADGKPKTAVKVGGQFSQFPSERSVWVIVQTGEVLVDGDVAGIGEAVAACPGTPAAEAEKPTPEPGPRCNAIEGATGINCCLNRLHSKDIDHEGWHTPRGENDSVGYPLFVRWPWNQWDRDAAEVGFEMPLPDWEREILEKEASKTANGQLDPQRIKHIADLLLAGKRTMAIDAAHEGGLDWAAARAFVESMPEWQGSSS